MRISRPFRHWLAWTLALTLAAPGLARAQPEPDMLLGNWHSLNPAHAPVNIRADGDSMFMVSRPGVFDATCWVDGANLIGFARFVAPLTTAPRDWARFQLLRATRTGPTTLQVLWISP